MISKPWPLSISPLMMISSASRSNCIVVCSAEEEYTPLRLNASECIYPRTCRKTCCNSSNMLTLSSLFLLFYRLCVWCVLIACSLDYTTLFFERLSLWACCHPLYDKWIHLLPRQQALPCQLKRKLTLVASNPATTELLRGQGGDTASTKAVEDKIMFFR